MTDALKSFRQKADGPARLRASLRRDTQRLGALLASFDAPRAVRSEVSRDVLGGDIFNIMSARLSGLLQHDEPPAAPRDAARAGRATTRPDSATNHHPTTRAPFVHPARSAKTNSASAPPSSNSMQRAPADVTPVFEKAAAKSRTSMTGDVLRHESFAAPAEAGTRDGMRSPFQTPAAETRRPEREQTTPDSMLLNKLREYRQLNERAPSSGNSAAPSHAAEPPPPHVRPLPAAPSGDTPRARWPEVTGRQFARKLNAAASAASGSFKHAQQTVNTDAPERIEIQNIFNVEVRADGAGSAASLPADLSESIADILREQAVQHGIDLT